MADKPLKPFTKKELAETFIKEVAAGTFSSKRGARGAAANAADVLRRRKSQPGGLDFDSNTYKSRQHTDDSNP